MIFQRRQWHPTLVLLPGKSHGWRSLVGCSPWGHKESDTTAQLHFHFSPSCFGEGNGNPLQCSCLENPRDGGAWWATVYGVAQSQTWLKWLSSSSSSSSSKWSLKEDILCSDLNILSRFQFLLGEVENFFFFPGVVWGEIKLPVVTNKLEEQNMTSVYACMYVCVGIQI